MTAWLRAGWFWVVLGVVLADQATKALIGQVAGPHFSHAVIPGLLNLVYTRNPGVAFGILAGAGSARLRVALLVFSAGAIALLLWLLATGRGGRPRSRVGLALILGGAAGNVVDRVMDGSVVDFLDLHVGSYHWPAFNLADSAITIGAALVIMELVFGRRQVEAQGA